jgi:hypothetical protein
MEIIEKQSEITSAAKHNNISSYKITGSAPMPVLIEKTIKTGIFYCKFGEI